MDIRGFFRRKKRAGGPAEEQWGEELSSYAPPPKPKIRWNIVLFFLTVLTTVFAGALQEGVNPLETPGLIYRGFPFSFSLMGILLAHEFGHYLAAKRHGLNVTLPYFIPAPPIIGTFGAFIKMRSPVRDRRMLMDVGAAGPLVGVIVAIPLLIAGLRLSEVRLIEGEAGMNLGSSLLLSLLSRIVVGSLPEGYDIVIHPVGFAGWIGLLVTALNLLPIGQLDGGHVGYALFGEWQNRISKFVYGGLIVLGVFGWQGWLVWAVLLWFLGIRHPVPTDWWIPLDRKRKVIGWVTVGVFILTFIPVPFSGL
jgi:membrane-associated protease RseP (regulator of RpoE activity)